MVSVNTYKNSVNPWWDVRCRSTDYKPMDGVPNGSTCIEIDTGKGFLFDAVEDKWHEIPAGSSVVINPATGVEF